ncbi:MAG: FHA domain-containing protein [Candidatus Latescibacteria bacterium]|jgi:pSer/pThr/pTyr-binding forkhead associated (FHA) protein|nr:FHA domain-containing protein [Candidatus Latescibacterota bacterium]
MHLFILNGKDEGRHLKLNAGKYIIGRSKKSDIILTHDQYISGTHAELSYNKSGKLTIKDLGSSNGTYLLGEYIEQETKITPGDIFRVGHTFFKITMRDNERFLDSGSEPSEIPEAIVVIDLVGSSKIAQALGDRVASKVKNVIFDKLHENLTLFPSEFSKNTGDGYMIIFTKPLDAVLFSVKLMQDLIGEGQYKGFHIRIGINYGETIKLPDGDRRGMAVDMAFRIESVKINEMHQTIVGLKKDMMPRVDRVFISEVVYNLIASKSAIKTRIIGFFDLKGFTGRHKIYEVIF